MNISEKDKKVLIYFGMFLIGFVYFYVFFNKDISKIKSLKLEKKNVSQQLNVIENKVKTFNDNKNNYDEIKKDYVDISRKMPANQDEKFCIMDIKNISSKYAGTATDFGLSKKEAVPFEKDKKKIEKFYSIGSKLNLQMDYNSLKELIKNGEEYDVLYSIENLSLSSSENGKVNSSFDIKFYSYDDNKAPLREWKDIPVGTGKENIFLYNSPSKVSTNAEDEMAKADENKDFLVLLNTLNAPTGNVTIEKSGKGIDIFGKNKTVENVYINLEGKNGKYSYSMSTEGDSYPKDGSKEAFETKTDNIIIMVSSLQRKYSEDKNVIMINVCNKTDKKVFVYITNEDEKMPRAMVTKDGEGIYVYKK